MSLHRDPSAVSAVAASLSLSAPATLSILPPQSLPELSKIGYFLRSGLEGGPLAAKGASDQVCGVGCAGGTVRGPREGETHSQAWPTSAQAELRTLLAAPQDGSHSPVLSKCQAADERPRAS